MKKQTTGQKSGRAAWLLSWLVDAQNKTSTPD